MPGFRDTGPNLSRPERDPAAIKQCLWAEVAAANALIGRTPGIDIIAPLPVWEVTNAGEKELSAAFTRARKILEVISHGHPQEWQHEYGVFVQLDPSLFANKPADTQANTTRLLQLVALSRADLIPSSNPALFVPSRENTEAIIGQMREELGVSEVYSRQMVTGYDPSLKLPVTFPEVDDDKVVQALIDGRLAVGNPDSPTQPWQYPLPGPDFQGPS